MSDRNQAFTCNTPPRQVAESFGWECVEAMYCHFEDSFLQNDHPSQPSQAPQEPPPGHQHCGQEIPWNQVNIDVVLACMLPVDHAEFDLMQW